MHALVTPMIYSRFDIVWPETQNSTESSRGVDALTYGLATLVMREDIFTLVTYPSTTACGVACQSVSCPHCGSISYLSKDTDKNSQSRISRRGNFFSQFVKKFSLGNGPSDWVQEYLVTKESGKMLGTLVALSVARMPNLETFVWDMPTGVLRDIWIALSSLGDNQQSKLGKLWIRFHDNYTALKDAGISQPAMTSQSAQGIPGAAISLPPTQQSPLMNPEQYGVKKVLWVDNHVETPNFSSMPPLTSLTVLNIDEVNYLQELAILIARSLSKLRELRLGLATTLNIPLSTRQSTDAAPLFEGGVLSLLMSRLHDHINSNAKNVGSSNLEEVPKGTLTPVNDQTKNAAPDSNANSLTSRIMNLQLSKLGNVNPGASKVENIDSSISTPGTQAASVNFDAIDPVLRRSTQPVLLNETSAEQSLKPNMTGDQIQTTTMAGGKDVIATNGIYSPASTAPFDTMERLKLEVLEIEKITKLNPVLMSKAIDFTMLTSLTVLHCGDCSSLWDRLRRDFAPRISRSTLGLLQKTKEPCQHTQSQGAQSSTPSPNDMEYRLRLRRIFTDAVSSELISFLKTTLAPNSLEWMFLRDNEASPSPVTLEAIYRGPIRRHRSSLTKVMIDSSYGSLTSRLRTSSARKWMLNRDILAFISSGKMCKLRELAFALEYKDWHFFLQRLPNIPHLRSFYIPTMSDHPYGNALKIRDFALGAIDVVALRPEVQLCYIGIKDKCFEISEKTVKEGPKARSATHTHDHPTSDEETEDGDHHDDDDDDDSEDESAAQPAPNIEPGAMDSDLGSITTEDEGGDEVGKKKTKLKLRDILFYDDKISIFKARHGRL